MNEEIEFTYEKRLGWRNRDHQPAVKGVHFGKIMVWLTKYGLPVVVPDHWEGSEMDTGDFEELPKGVTGITFHGGSQIKLWHDDVRMPPDRSWAWVRTNEDARAAMTEYEVLEISMDNDLGLHELDYDHPDADYWKGDGDDDGVALAKWMIEAKNVPQSIEIHSMNPERAEVIRAMLEEHCLKITVKPFNPEMRTEKYEFQLQLKGSVGDQIEVFVTLNDQVKSATIYFDGSGGSPRGSSAACVIVSDETQEIVAEFVMPLEVCSNNIAEYQGLLLALNAASQLGISEVSIFSDSQLVVNQVNGRWDVNNESLLSLRDQAWELGQSFDSLELSWIPREENKRADWLCSQTLNWFSPHPKKQRRGGRSREQKKRRAKKRNVFLPPEVDGERDPASFV